MEKFAYLQLRQDITEELRIKGLAQVYIFFNTKIFRTGAFEFSWSYKL